MHRHRTVTRALSLGAALVLLAALAGVASARRSAAPPGSGVARLQDASGNRLGSVWFLPRASGKLAIRVSASFLSEGFHGFHVHAVGTCEPPFTTAGKTLGSGTVSVVAVSGTSTVPALVGAGYSYARCIVRPCRHK